MFRNMNQLITQTIAGCGTVEFCCQTNDLIPFQPVKQLHVIVKENAKTEDVSVRRKVKIVQYFVTRKNLNVVKIDRLDTRYWHV